jgi:serine/threonine protein kinase
MSLTPGTRLGPYEIEAPLGAGGMGDVYRARDTRLHRDVAIKVLPAISIVQRRERPGWAHGGSPADTGRTAQSSVEGILSACYLALIYAGLGMRDQVLEHLERPSTSASRIWPF